MSFKLRPNEKRVINNFYEPKVITKKDFYATAMDDKNKSFIIVFEKTTRLDAVQRATKWAKRERLKLGHVNAFQNSIQK